MPWYRVVLGVLIGVATIVCGNQQPDGALYFEDFSSGLPGNWEGGTLITEGLPEGSKQGVAAVPGKNLGSNHAWVNGHFTVRDGLYFNIWARQDVSEWYQVWMYCKTPGEATEGMNLYESKPKVTHASVDWHLVSIPFSEFRCTSGSNKGNAPLPGEVCWMYFWGFLGRDLGMQVDRVWVSDKKPSEQPAVAEALRALPELPSWDFRAPHDRFDSAALLDLRGLNEQVAGESGFVRLSPDGSGFVNGAGQELRFWATNTYAYRRDHSLKRHTRILAKRGVNMLRFHGNITPEKGDALSKASSKEREHLWRLVAAAKENGIYTTFSPYYAMHSRVKPEMGVLDGGDGKNFGLLFFDTQLQAAYKGWLRQVLSERNPHTGVSLAEDPALAIIQLQNEDSLFFWTSQGIQGEAAQELRRRFADFVIEKYGSLREVQRAWAGASHEDDQGEVGELGLFIVWHLTQATKSRGQATRLADQTEFFTEIMRRFNTEMARYLREDLGCKQLINAGNWRTADNTLLLDAERYAYSANEVIGVNRYWTGEHQGRRKGWAIINGDRFTDPSILKHPRDFPLAIKQVQGYPTIIPESNWVPPLSHLSEGPFLVASYQSLTGVGPLYWFGIDGEGFRDPSSANAYLPSLGKWVCETPMAMGQWPAAALMYRRGYIKRGDPVVREERSLDDLWHRRMPIIAEGAGYDPNRDAHRIPRESRVTSGVNPMAYFVGPVTVAYNGDASRNWTAPLDPYINEVAQVVRSNTGELLWDYGRGLCLLDSPCAQGATGFLSEQGSFELSSIRFNCSNQYASFLAVSMDGEPLKTSGRILLQMGTTTRPTGWKTRAVHLLADKVKLPGEVILNIGKPPWRIVRGELSLHIDNPALTTAHVLDANGTRIRDIAVKNGDLQFPEDALYVVLE